MTPRRLIEPARHAGAALLRGQSDERLIDLTRAGNEQAFEAIVQRYRRPLLRYCSRILPPGRAEDAVQQTFLSAFNAISNGDTELKLRPWLYRIAHNSALNLLRQNGWNHEQLDDQFDGVLRPDQAVEARERLDTLVASVKDLPERQRDAIVLRELEGRSYEEIAGALGVTDGAVRQLLNRARTTLRAAATALTPYGLAARLAAAASGGGAPAVTERIAEITAGAGGVATLAKVGAAVLVAGAVATGATNQGVPGVGGRHHHGDASEAALLRLDKGNGRAHGRGPGESPGAKSHANRGRGGERHGDRRGSRRGSGRSPSGSHEHVELVSGHGGSGSSGGGSGTSGGEHSGSGSSGGSGTSGSGDRSGSGTSGGSVDNSGPGSLSSGDGSSGTSGTSGSSDGGSSGSSGPGSGETTTTTTTTTTSSSGPGSGDSSITSGGGTSGGPG